MTESSNVVQQQLCSQQQRWLHSPIATTVQLKHPNKLTGTQHCRAQTRLKNSPPWFHRNLLVSGHLSPQAMYHRLLTHFCIMCTHKPCSKDCSRSCRRLTTVIIAQQWRYTKQLAHSQTATASAGVPCACNAEGSAEGGILFLHLVDIKRLDHTVAGTDLQHRKALSGPMYDCLSSTANTLTNATPE